MLKSLSSYLVDKNFEASVLSGFANFPSGKFINGVGLSCRVSRKPQVLTITKFTFIHQIIKITEEEL